MRHPNVKAISMRDTLAAQGWQPAAIHGALQRAYAHHCNGTLRPMR